MDHKTFFNKVVKASNLDIETCISFQNALSQLIEDSLASGETVAIPSFGNFESRKRNERIMAHPSEKGKRLLIPPKVVVSFKPSTILKNKINKKMENE